ncbi:universal stress protein [Nitriliruptoraceae bacterium ZYF776]|nr:universal stress protein [Profundirhabdus halotolerans]
MEQDTTGRTADGGPGQVLAALEPGPGFAPTSAAARTMASLFGTEVRGCHVVRPPGDAAAVTEAAAMTARAGFPVAVEEGPVVATLAAVSAEPRVALGVVGAGDRPGRLGHVAAGVAEATPAPLLVVPVGAEVGGGREVRRALVALDGDPRSTAAVRDTADRLAARGVEVVLLHVFDPRRPPRFDTGGHGLAAWREEFLRRHGPASDVALRSGDPGTEVAASARQEDADLLVLSWEQQPRPGHAEVVRAALLNPKVPVLLLHTPGIEVPEGRAARPRAAS